MLRLVAILYFLINIPYRIAFHCDGLDSFNSSSSISLPTSIQPSFQQSIVFDWILDAFFIFDAFLTAKMFVQEADKELIYHPKLLGAHYLRCCKVLNYLIIYYLALHIIIAFFLSKFSWYITVLLETDK